MHNKEVISLVELEMPYEIEDKFIKGDITPAKRNARTKQMSTCLDK